MSIKITKDVNDVPKKDIKKYEAGILKIEAEIDQRIINGCMTSKQLRKFEHQRRELVDLYLDPPVPDFIETEDDLEHCYSVGEAWGESSKHAGEVKTCSLGNYMTQDEIRQMLGPFNSYDEDGWADELEDCMYDYATAYYELSHVDECERLIKEEIKKILK